MCNYTVWLSAMKEGNKVMWERKARGQGTYFRMCSQQASINTKTETQMSQPWHKLGEKLVQRLCEWKEKSISGQSRESQVENGSR